MAFDLFEFYRFMLAVLVGTYGTVRLISSIWRWQGLGKGGPRTQALFRRYVLIQLARVRFRRFWWDFVTIAMLAFIFILLVRWHW